MECSGADLKTLAAWEDKQFGTGSTYTGQPTLEKYDDSTERRQQIHLGGYGVKSPNRPLIKDRPPIKFLRGQKSIGGYTSDN